MNIRIIIGFMCLTAAATGFAATDQNKKQDNVDQQTVQTKSPSSVAGIVTAKKPELVLHLNANPTTGYSWLLISYPKQLVELEGHQYMPTTDTAHRVGAGGKETWRFKAKPAAFIAPQVIAIKMIYARPWEVNDGMKPQTFYFVSS